jgi:hypothetical protein
LADLWNAVVYPFKFSDRTLGSHVECARHALAIDEERASFAPVLWKEKEEEEPNRIKQVWFAGVHANVGGGYPRQGMSLVALDWMMKEAGEHGLRFVPSEREFYKSHADVGDKLYNSRAGFGMFYRWKPRNVSKLCRLNCVPISREKREGEKELKPEPRLHRSIFERLVRGTEGYASGAVPPPKDIKVLIDQLESRKPISYQEKETSLNLFEKFLSCIGKGASWLPSMAVIAVVFVIVIGFGSDVMQHAHGDRLNYISQLFSIQWLEPTQWLKLILQTIWQDERLAILSGVSIFVGLFGVRWIKRHLERSYSAFWSGERFTVREALWKK